MNSINPIRKWVVIFRLHSILFIVPPFLLGVLVAVYSGGYTFKVFFSLLGFLPLLFNHMAANLLSDIHDFRKGIDVKANFFSGGIVRGWIDERLAMRVVIALFTLAFLTGIYLLFKIGMVLLPFFLLGCLLGVFYSTGDNYAFKYNVTGEWSIFLGFGILIPLYGYILNAGDISLLPVIIALPSAFLIAAVKHANNWIAALSPGNLEKYTAASLLGEKASRLFYYLLVILPYILVPLMLSRERGSLPVSTLIVYFSLPMLLLLIYRAAEAKRISPDNRIIGLDSVTAMLYVLFLSLSCISVIVG